MIPVPLHGTLPSGHATEATMFAYVLWELLKDADAGGHTFEKSVWGDQLMRQASRIAVNRTIAGVHFPVDSVAGAMLGLTLGRYLVARCKGGEYAGWHFDGAKFDAKCDFNWHALFDLEHGQTEASPYVRRLHNYDLTPSNLAILPSLWQTAKYEWVAPASPSGAPKSWFAT